MVKNIAFYYEGEPHTKKDKEKNNFSYNMWRSKKTGAQYKWKDSRQKEALQQYF